MPYLGSFRLEFQKTIVIFEIKTLDFAKFVFLVHTVNFGIGSGFSEGLRFAFSEDPSPLYKVCHNLNRKNMLGNKKFWISVTRLRSNKTIWNEKISLIDRDELIDIDAQSTRLQNLFFSNAMGHLKLEEHTYCKPLSESITDPLLQVIVNLRNHCCIKAFERV